MRVVIIIQAINLYITLARPKHWFKNIFIFISILYAQNLTKPDLFLSVTRCFIAFCLISSAVYVINDIADAEKDCKHPTKNKRPIASGRVEKSKAAIFAIILLLASFPLVIYEYDNCYVALFAALYVVLNLAYSFVLKHHALVDCFCIAAGFIIRLFAGGAANNEHISGWLFLTMISVSLFMAFGKRRGEMIHVTDTATTRQALTNYDLSFLNGMIFVCAGLSIVFYSLWAMLSVSTMLYTVPVVLFIVCKYLLIAHGDSSHADPTTIILGDKDLIIAIGVFIFLSIMLLYF